MDDEQKENLALACAVAVFISPFAAAFISFYMDMNTVKEETFTVFDVQVRTGGRLGSLTIVYPYHQSSLTFRGEYDFKPGLTYHIFYTRKFFQPHLCLESMEEVEL